MWNKLRTAVAPTVVVLLAAYGMAYAATGTPNPINLMSDHGKSGVHVTPKPSHTPEAKDDTDDPGNSPEASHTPKPKHAPKASHGPERSTDGCPEGSTVKNHGQFVSGSEDHEAAAQAECGKPVHPEHSPDVEKDKKGDDQGAEVEHGHDESPEPSESPEKNDAGEHHDKG